MVRMGPDVPLLNEYKQEFFWKRFPQTVLGGPRFKLGYCAPPYVYVNQAVLFLAPWLFGGISTLLCQLQLLPELHAAVLSGLLMFGVAAGVQALALYAVRRNATVERLGVNNILTDEEEVEFTHCVSPDTVHFIAPGKRFGLNIVLHTVLAGVLCGFGTWYMFLSRLTTLYNSIGASLVIFVLSWVTLCIAEYSLIVNTATETATFQAQDTYEITPLTRPVYIFIFISVDLVERFSGTVPELHLASQILHVLFLFLPLLWALGMLPPLDALLLWAMEQILVFGLGGSPMSSNLRLLLMFCVSSGVAVCNYFIPSTTALLLFSVSMGFLLSLDLSQTRIFCKGSSEAFRDQLSRGGSPAPPPPPRSFGWTLGCREILLYITLMLVAGVEAGLLHHFLGKVQSLSFVSGPQTLVGYVLLVVFCLSWVLREVQGAYVFGGFFLNPFYPKGMSNIQTFKQRNKGLHMAAALRRVLISLVSPLAMIAFLAMDQSLLQLHKASHSIGLTRAFRVVWQSTEEGLLHMVVVILLRLIAGDKVLQGWDSLGTGIQLLLVGLVVDRLSQFLYKLKFSVTVLVTSWTEKKQRRQSAGTLLALNASLWPLLLAVVTLSALLSAPLLPLFTLPIFLVGFPRPQRSWPGPVGTACPCPDSVFYQQMSESLASALRMAFARGSLGSLAPGSHFLGRFQDRMVWIMILERGYGYCTVNIKGLELQETSCHTVEARRVDEVFETAFERPEHLGLTQGFNLHWGNALTPCAALTVRVYSDARNVLSGIIDSHDNLRKLQNDFLKALVWLLLRYCVQKHKGFYWSCDDGSGMGGRRSQSSQLAHTTCVQPAEPALQSNMSSLKFRQDSSSMTSFGEWSDEDDLFGPQTAKRTVALVTAEAHCGSAALQPGASLPGSVEMDSLFENMALSALQPLQPLGLGIGLPAADRGPHSEVFGERLGSLPPLNFSCPQSEVFNLPSGWRTAPLLPSRLLQLKPLFPEDWFRFALGRFGPTVQSDTTEDMTKALKEDEALKELHCHVTMSCLVSLGAESAFTSPSYVYRLYCGDIPWTDSLDWLSSCKELYQIALQAFRFSFKLLFDQASLGPMESAEELFSALEEYERDWYIGLVSEKGWHDSVLREKPFLFSLGHDLTMGTYTGRVLSLQEQLMQVGRLNGEGVRGQWANLSWELLYATNDDEERYSIQAHPFLLRNLTVQAADPPLGYPIYSSVPLHFPSL
ncbi:pecanex-like protein 4 [Boleophthalmus pectinirostris]|uniref:pecanex-like protein 4 n=1 Tax=Boleophthalmus pectinirostris TaxID=150288 RepID=UPI00242FB30E|nr:pecanex-like protein 4 [Boleophthalmus pectinirostris]